MGSSVNINKRGLRRPGTFPNTCIERDSVRQV